MATGDKCPNEHIFLGRKTGGKWRGEAAGKERCQELWQECTAMKGIRNSLLAAKALRMDGVSFAWGVNLKERPLPELLFSLYTFKGFRI